MLDQEKIIAMAIAVIAEEMETEISQIKVTAFREVYGNNLEQYIRENNIAYKKYQLGD